MEAPDYPPVPNLERGLDLLFPPTCVGCKRVGRWICARCWDDVPWISEQTCGACGRRSWTPLCSACTDGMSSLDSLVAVAEFDGIAREAVHTLKFHGGTPSPG